MGKNYLDESKENMTETYGRTARETREGAGAGLMNRIKRKLLIIDDNFINREILGELLGREYELLFADNGETGLKLLADHYRELSLVLLDVYMPVNNGFEFLESIAKDPLLSSVPVIVMTESDKPEDEVRCLNLGAVDFVTKPYHPEVVRGRVRSVIKLKESVATLSAVEFDSLTGLYTMSAFYHHTERLLAAAPEKSFDLSVADLKDFKLVNSIFGEKVGDEVLIRIADGLRALMPEAVLGRQGDHFFAFYESRLEFTREESAAALNYFKNLCPIPSLAVKYGVYKDVDRTLPVSILCDRTVMAANSAKEDAPFRYAEYDRDMQERMVEDRRMELRFEEALEKGEFAVWFQPKVDAVTEKIVAAEALIRWIPASGRMLSPGRFIPLFEKNGMISRLDRYVFEKVCKFQRQQREAGKALIPISVNLSRNSIYQMDTVSNYVKIIEENEVPKSMVPIELTESAAIESQEMRELTALFSSLGFPLHMDDFGTGYSSLSGLVTMPFNAVKMDKLLIDHIGNSKGNTLIRHMIRIFREIGMEVVAEGVESRGQAEFLRAAGCDRIQGYYYYRPMPEDAFRALLGE